jgi:polar amino acid transport system substrate-binding protein
MVAPVETIGYANKQSGDKLTTLGPPVYMVRPNVYLLKQGDAAFASAIARAVDALIADGVYRRILDRCGAGAIGAAAVDSASPAPIP